MFHLNAGSNKHYKRIFNSARLIILHSQHISTRDAVLWERGWSMPPSSPCPQGVMFEGTCMGTTPPPTSPPQQPPSLPPSLPSTTPRGRQWPLLWGHSGWPGHSVQVGICRWLQVEEGEQEPLAGSGCSQTSPMCLSCRTTEYFESEGPTRTIKSNS